MGVNAGQAAETAAERFLLERGFKLIERNWRNRFAELDLVVERDQSVHFVEVKYRASHAYGTGFEYITADKRRRLLKAAQAWMAERNDLRDYQIDVIAITGDLGNPQLEYLANCIQASA